MFGALNGVSVSDGELVGDKQWKSYGLSFSLKNTPGVQSIVTTGSPPKKIIFVVRDNIILCIKLFQSIY